MVVSFFEGTLFGWFEDTTHFGVATKTQGPDVHNGKAAESIQVANLRFHHPISAILLSAFSKNLHPYYLHRLHGFEDYTLNGCGFSCWLHVPRRHFTCF